MNSTRFMGRRSCLAAMAALPWLTARAADILPVDLQGLEAGSGGRLGAVLLGPRGVLASYRAEELFPACSTFKALLAAQALHKNNSEPGLLQRRLAIRPSDLKTFAPVTSRFVDRGMTVGELCAATMIYSDNVAANLLMGEFGGPAALTAFVRQLGDPTFRLDRWEPELNTATPGDPRDTCTPLHMARNLHRLVLGDALGAAGRTQLEAWLVANTTGDKRIRAGAPADWRIGDKTGTGEYGTTNDIAVLWAPRGSPLLLTVYFTQSTPDAKAQDEILAEATRRCLAAL